MTYGVQSQKIAEFNNRHPNKRVAVSSSSPLIAVDLDYGEVFDAKIKSFNGEVDQTGFCSVYPSEIIADYQNLVPLPLEGSEDYSNIIYFDGYLFLLDTNSFTILAAEIIVLYEDDYEAEEAFIRISSSFENKADSAGQIEEPNFVVDETNGILFIALSQTLYSYPVLGFMDALDEEEQPPSLSQKASGYSGYESVRRALCNKGLLYIVADNYVEVYNISSNGDVTPLIKFDAAFFAVSQTSIVDIAFKDNYIFLLDDLDGLYVLKNSPPKSNADGTSSVTNQFSEVANLRQSQSKGEFMEVIGDSIHIISIGGKTPSRTEYTIYSDPVINKIELNKMTLLDQSPRDTYSDDKFLYLITGFFNEVAKHSIPAKYQTQEVEMYASEYWPVYGTKAMISSSFDTVSIAAVLQESYISLYTFEQSAPAFSCNVTGINEGTYVYEISTIQNNCEDKQRNKISDFNTVCTFDQTVEVVVLDPNSRIGSTSAADRFANFLLIGLGVGAFVLIIFLCCCTRYKRQYHMLEEKIKFHKIENDSTDKEIGGNKGQKAASSADVVNPQSINIQRELEKAEAAEKKKEDKINPFSSTPGENEKPNAEFGDLKPLDIDEIYGKSSKKHEDSF